MSGGGDGAKAMNGAPGSGPAERPGDSPTLARRTVVITNPQGLHLRPAATFAKKAREFTGRVNVIRDAKAVNGKSQVALLLPAADPGTGLTVEVEGENPGGAPEGLVAPLAAENSDEEK